MRKKKLQHKIWSEDFCRKLTLDELNKVPAYFESELKYHRRYLENLEKVPLNIWNRYRMNLEIRSQKKMVEWLESHTRIMTAFRELPQYKKL